MAGDTRTTAPAGQGGLAALPPTEGLQQLFVRLRDTLLHNYPLFIQRGGEESLHDLRVSLRRLRSLLRNYRRVLHLDTTLVEQLRGVQQQSNPARDLEVFVALLKRHDPQTPQFTVLQQQLEGSYAHLRDELPAGWKEIQQRLQQPLSANERLEGFKTQGELSAHIGTRQLARIENEMKSLHHHWDEAQVHRLRIHGKRLRYLLEPFAGIPRVDRALRELRQLQDGLGDYRDLQLLLSQLATWHEEEGDRELTARLLARQQTLEKRARGYSKKSRQQRLLHTLNDALKSLQRP